MQMTPSIILAGQPLNALGAIQQGNQAAAQTNALRDQNNLRNLYASQGAGILSGDQGALNALAGLDPAAAMGMQQGQLGMAATRQNMQFDAEKMQMAREQAKLAAAQHAASMTAAERAQAAKELADGLSGAAYFYQKGDRAGYDTFLAQNGIDPSTHPFDAFPAHAAQYEGVLDALKSFDALANPKAPDPLTDEGKRTVDIRHGYIDPNQKPQVDPKEVDKFRKEFSGLPAVKSFSEQSQAYGRIVASAKDPSPAGDLSMIFNFMKVLDPGSVVRESEFATAAQASAWLQQSELLGVDVPRPIAQAIRSIENGQRLSPEQRADFLGRAGALYDNAEQVYKSVEDQFKAIADSRGYPMDQSVINYRYTGDRGDQAGSPPPPPPDGTLSPADDALIQKYLGTGQ